MDLDSWCVNGLVGRKVSHTMKGMDFHRLLSKVIEVDQNKSDVIPALAGFQRVHRLGDFIMSVTSSSPHENHSAPIQNASDLGGLGCF